MALPETIWQGGQMTDLPLYTGQFDGSELFEIVAPGNAALGENFRITADQLASQILGVLAGAAVIVNGATSGSPLILPVTPARFLVKKLLPSPTSLIFLTSGAYPAPVLIRDIAGNADTNPISVTFFGAELADGLSVVTINTPYGGYVFNPLPAAAGLGWYIGTA